MNNIPNQIVKEAVDKAAAECTSRFPVSLGVRDFDFIPAIQQCALESFVAGMSLAMRICRNRAEDIRSAGKIMTMAGNEADNCVGVIRIVQVEIATGRSQIPGFTYDEIDEIRRIY